jgi:hypothetical protein
MVDLARHVSRNHQYLAARLPQTSKVPEGAVA